MPNAHTSDIIGPSLVGGGVGGSAYFRRLSGDRFILPRVFGRFKLHAHTYDDAIKSCPPRIGVGKRFMSLTM